MDWNAAIDRNREALKRIVALLCAMAGIVAGADGTRRAGGGEGMLRRARHRSLLQLIRPAEAAVRRLVAIVARDLPPEERITKPPKMPRSPSVRSKITMHAGVRCRLTWRPGERFPSITPLPPREAPTRIGFALLDPLRLPGRQRRKYVPAHLAPRITCLTDEVVRRPLPEPPSPDDFIDATRVCLRLAAISRVLDDLPRQARSLVRWKARNENLRRQGVACRVSPMRPGLPPGIPRSPARRRNSHHDVHAVLREVHALAFDASADTS